MGQGVAHAAQVDVAEVVDPVALDAYATTMAAWGGKTYKPEEIPFIMKAAALGVGTFDLAKLNILKKSA